MNFSLQKSISRFGIILCRLSLLGVIASVCLIFSPLLVILIYLILLIIGLLSLLTLFFNENFRNLFDVTNSFNEILTKAQAYFPILMGISLAFLICGFLCQIVDYKDQSTKPKLFFYGIFIGIAFLLFLIPMIGGFVNV